MKTRTVAAISLVSGLGLAGTFAYLAYNGGPAPAPVAVSSSGQHTTEGASPRVAEAPSAFPRFFTNTTELDWSQVESDDYRKYVANLRAIGCPEPTVRDIIVADVNKLFEERAKALQGPPPEKFEFWKRSPVRAADEEQRVKERIALAREKRALLKSLLGVEVADTTPLTQTPGQDQRVSFLSAEKRQQVEEVNATFHARMRSAMGDRMRPSRDDMDTYRVMETERRAELAKVLSPEEAETYELNTSRISNFLRGTLGDFQMTEQEFRAIFKLRQAYEDQYGYSYGPEDDRTLGPRVALEKEIRSVMGDERYNQYIQEQNWTTSSLQNVARDFGVPKETAVKVFELKPIAQEQAVQIRADQSLGPEQRREALQRLQTETMRSIGELIGAPAAEAYYREGSWIRGLAQSEQQRSAPMR